MLWIANAIIILGLWLIGYKWRHAFLFTAVGEALYLVWAFQNGMTELGLLCVVFCFLAIRNWWKWGRIEVTIITSPSDLYEMLRKSAEDIKVGRLHDHEQVKRECQ